MAQRSVARERESGRMTSARVARSDAEEGEAGEEEMRQDMQKKVWMRVVREMGSAVGVVEEDVCASVTCIIAIKDNSETRESHDTHH